MNAPEQLVLISEPRVRHSDGDTSRAAAEAVARSAPLIEQNIWTAISRRGPMTDDELVRYLDCWYGPTLRTARSRATKRGLLVDSGIRRLSNRGRAQIVWRLAP